MFGWFKSRKPDQSKAQIATLASTMARTLKARYDAAQTTDENSKHWAVADNLSANAANSHAVRLTLRKRARYEFANNCFCNGMVRTLAFHTVGTGPRLQIQTGNIDADHAIEAAWECWAKQIRLAGKLVTMRQTMARDGEAFGLLTTNRRLNCPIQLDIRLLEADQVANPYMAYETRNHLDGIELDDIGNVLSYTVLKYHPGDTFIFNGIFEHNAVPAEQMVHLFREDRPGQRRGIPEITPALPLYAVLRRYTLATLGAAEIAAMLSLFLRTNASGIDPADLGDPFQLMNIERNTMTTLPDGWDVSQMKAEQPTTTYDSFQRAIIREIARCLDMPFNIAACDSSGYNYSSGRLDHQTYFAARQIDREEIETHALDQRIFPAWLDEAALIPGLIPPNTPPISDWFHQWQWDGWESIDPDAEANATKTRLTCGMTSIPDECSREGTDYEAVQENQAKALGLTIDEYRKRLADSFFQQGQGSPPASGGSAKPPVKKEVANAA